MLDGLNNGRNPIHVKLTSIVPYHEDEEEIWYFHLIYTVKYFDGSEESYIIPKAENPFPVSGLSINIDRNYDELSYTSSMSASICGDARYPVYIYLNSERCFYKAVELRSAKKEIQELTIEEIEEKLGYPVKIVRKEDEE